MELRQRAATDRALPGDLRPFPSTRSRDTCLSGCPASRHLEILQLLYRDLRKQRFGLFTILDVKAQLAEKNKAGKTKEDRIWKKSYFRGLSNTRRFRYWDWFRCVDYVAATEDAGTSKWTTETIQRDQLLLRMLGVN